MANPYIVINVKTAKGTTKKRKTTVKLNQINPIWTDEKFVFHGPIFPIELLCKSAQDFKKIKTKDKRNSLVDDILGTYEMNEDCIKKLDQPTQVWCTLKTKSTHEEQNNNKPRIYIEILLTAERL